MRSYINTAIESARNYYEELEKKDKGTITYNVSKIQSRDKYIELFLSGIPKFFESLQIKINTKIIPSSEIQIISFNSDDKVLLVYVSENLIAKELLTANANDVKVFSDLKFLIQRVENWYEQNGDKLKFPVTNPNIESIKSFENISDDQKDAINGIFNSSLSYIWGAPGTGKTSYVLSNCIINYLQANKTVFITAPTNNAVDQTLDNILSVLKSNNIEYTGKVIRLGTPSANFIKKYPEVCENNNLIKAIENNQKLISTKEKIVESLKTTVKKLDNITKNYDNSDAIETELKKHCIELSKFEVNLSVYYKRKNCRKNIIFHSQKCIDKLIDNQNIYNKKSNDLNNASKIAKNELRINQSLLNETAVNIQEYIKDIDQLDSKIKNFDSKFQKIFHKKDLTLLHEEKEEKSEKYLNLLAIEKTLTEKIEKNEININKISQQLKENNIQISKHIFKTDEFQNQIKNCQTDLYITLIKTIKQIIKSIKHQIDTINNEIDTLTQSNTVLSNKSIDELKNYSIIGATLDTSLIRLVPGENDLSFDHVFLDEAGYCSLIKGATLLSYNCPITLLGDHKQLPPICEVDVGAHNKNISLWGQSIVHIESVKHFNLDDFYNEYKVQKQPEFALLNKYNLTKSFRFGESLATILDKNIYHINLSGNPSVYTELYYIDAEKSKSDNEKESLVETQLIINYVNQHPNENIGIITPYKKQRTLIKNNLRYKKDNVYTVHGSQGQEWDTVLFSVVGAKNKDLFLVSTRIPNSDSLRILNTAFSRAKKKLILVCDYDYWISKENELIQKILSIAEEKSP